MDDVCYNVKNVVLKGGSPYTKVVSRTLGPILLALSRF